jgi:3-isopropylmalate/(R)-2-methylmalate dehydratase large subunit
MSGQAFYDKLSQNHLVKQRDDGSVLIYIGRQLIRGVTSPQALAGLRVAQRWPWLFDVIK